MDLKEVDVTREAGLIQLMIVVWRDLVTVKLKFSSISYGISYTEKIDDTYSWNDWSHNTTTIQCIPPEALEPPRMKILYY